jgi:hypothetical protein
MSNGVADQGKIDVDGMTNALTFNKQVGNNFGKEFDAVATKDELWTDSFVDAAKAK